MTASVGSGRSGRARGATSGRYVRKVGPTRWAGRTVSARSAVTGRNVGPAERAAAARARVSADKKRGVTTAPWIVDLTSYDD